MAFILATGCGRGNGGSTAGDIEGVAVSGSTYAGLVVAAVENGVAASHVYWYDFPSGKVHELLSNESGNPALFWTDGRVFLFNRAASPGDYRTFDPRPGGSAPSAPQSLPGVAANEPFDVTSLSPGQTVALASPITGALQVLNYQTGTLTSVATTGLAPGTFRPHALMRAGSRLYALHSSIQQSPADNPALPTAVYALNLAADGTPSFPAPTAPATTVSGVALPFSFPVSFSDQDGTGGATLVGLCAEAWTGCASGTGRLAGGTTLQAEATSLSGLTYNDQSVTDGSSSELVYAHVRVSDGDNQVVKLDTITKTQTQIQDLGSDPRQVGLAYDPSSTTLFVGGLNETLTLYRNDQPAGSFELDGVPYSLVLVPQQGAP